MFHATILVSTYNSTTPFDNKRNFLKETWITEVVFVKWYFMTQLKKIYTESL